jgi:hypothetical protein
MKIRAASILLTLMLSGVWAWAHHSISQSYDLTKEVTITGVVTKIDWANPHAWVYLDVRDPAKGTVTNYAFEMGGPDRLLELGWTRTTLRIGATVKITGNPDKLGAPKVTAKSALLPDGKRLDAGQEWMPASRPQGTETPSAFPQFPPGSRGLPPPPPPPTPPPSRR